MRRLHNLIGGRLTRPNAPEFGRHPLDALRHAALQRVPAQAQLLHPSRQRRRGEAAVEAVVVEAQHAQRRHGGPRSRQGTFQHVVTQVPGVAQGRQGQSTGECIIKLLERTTA